MANLRASMALLIVAFALTMLWPEPSLLAFCVSYLLSLALFDALRVPEQLARLGRATAVALGLLVLAPATFALLTDPSALLVREGLYGLPQLLGERLALEPAFDAPTLAPRLLSLDRAQRLYVHAPVAADDADVRVQLPGVPPLHALSMGHGLFRIDYDPRRHGLPTTRDERLRARVIAGTTENEVELLAVRPLAHPRSLVRSPSGRFAAGVSNETDELALISARGLQRRVELPDAPERCAFLDEHTLVVTHSAGTTLSLVDVESGRVRAGPSLDAAQGPLARSPDGSRLALGLLGRKPALLVLSLPALSPLARIALDAPPSELAFGSDADTLLVVARGQPELRRYALRAGTLSLRDRLALGRTPTAMTTSRDGDSVLLAITDYRERGDRHLGNHFIQDQILRVDARPERDLRVVHVLHTAERSPRQSKPGDVDRGGSPLGLYEAPDGSLLIAFAGTDELWQLRPDAPEPLRVDLADGALYSPQGVTQLADGQVVVVAPVSGAFGMFALDQRGLLDADAAPRVLRLAPDDAHLRKHAPDALARRMGERTFYESTRSGIACQSCHAHGDSDYAAHNLGDRRLLPTLSVRGLLGTAPFLRDGSYAGLDDLDHVAQTLYRGYLRRAPARAHTLGMFLSALPRQEPPLDDDPERLAAERRGLASFVRARCVRCHTFPAFTNLRAERLGAVFPDHESSRSDDELLDTPSLLSIGSSAPYLSDGRARDLRELLSRYNAKNRHGDTRALDAAARADLVRFLESL